MKFLLSWSDSPLYSKVTLMIQFSPFIYFFLNCDKIDIKVTILTIISRQFSDIKYIHIVLPSTECFSSSFHSFLIGSNSLQKIFSSHSLRTSLKSPSCLGLAFTGSIERGLGQTQSISLTEAVELFDHLLRWGPGILVNGKKNPVNRMKHKSSFLKRNCSSLCDYATPRGSDLSG